MSFRLKSKIPQHQLILDHLRGMPKEEKVDLFVRAMGEYLGHPVDDAQSATIAALRQIVNDLLRVLDEANKLIRQMARGEFVGRGAQDQVEREAKELSANFIAAMNAQQRPARITREPSSDDEE